MSQPTGFDAPNPTARAVLEPLARVAPILGSVGHAPGWDSAITTELVDTLDRAMADLQRALEREDGRRLRQRARVARRLTTVEHRLRTEWASRLANGASSDIASLTEACRLLHRATAALQPDAIT